MRSLILTSTLISAALLGSQSAAADINERLNELEKELEKVRQETGTAKSDSDLKIFGTFRPVLKFVDDGNDNTTDLGDALSRFGLAGSTPVMENSKVFFETEWKIKVGSGGNIDGSSGGARKALVGIAGPMGQLSVGKQRPPQYNLIGGHVDIFNHAASPYAYDQVAGTAGFSNFFVDNSTVYQISSNGVDFQAAVGTNGSDGEDSTDWYNAGASYSTGMFYIAAAYVDATGKDGVTPALVGDEMKTTGVASYIDTGTFYLAAAYQDVKYTPQGGKEVDRSTIDVSAAYPLGNNYKAKAGIFEYDDGNKTNTSKKMSGFNLTIERQLADNIRVHTEYVSKDLDKGDTTTEVNFGIRYDFSADL